jgi:hypothetical protein
MCVDDPWIKAVDQPVRMFIATPDGIIESVNKWIEPGDDPWLSTGRDLVEKRLEVWSAETERGRCVGRVQIGSI